MFFCVLLLYRSHVYKTKNVSRTGEISRSGDFTRSGDLTGPVYPFVYVLSYYSLSDLRLADRFPLFLPGASRTAVMKALH